MSLNNNHLVSVILVTYNTAKFLNDALNSVFAQTYSNIEVIIFDDGSTDETIEIIQSYQSKFKLTTCYREHTGNVGKLRNEAMKLAKGGFIAFIDGDDVWREDKLEKQLKYVMKFDLVCSNAIEIDSSGNMTNEDMFNELSNGKLELSKLIFNNYVLTSSVIINKNILEYSGMFDEDVGIRGEDYILWLHIAECGIIYFDDDKLLSYRRHSQNLSFLNSKERKQLLLRTINIRKKYWNYKEEVVSQMAKFGCADLFSELSRISFDSGELKEAKHYCKEYLRISKDFLKIRYMKFVFLYAYLTIIKGA